MSSVTLVTLSEHPRFLETVARWHFAEWGALYSDQDLEDFIADLARSLGPGFVPTTWLLLEGDQVVASASVTEQDMETNRDLTPWLADVYVLPTKRGQGQGRKIVQEVMAHCAQAGLPRLYLFTADQRAFYSALGWRDYKTELYSGSEVVVMTRDLQESQ